MRWLNADATARVSTQVAAFAVALLTVVAWLLALGYDGGLVVGALWDGAAGTPGALTGSLGHAVPLMLTATSAWLAYQVGMFNVGPDGQLQLAGLATVAVVVALPDSWGAALIPAGIAAGAVTGALAAGLAVWLRLWRGASEVITTLMSVFIAANLVNVLISGPLRAPDAKLTAATERIPDGAQLGEMPGTGVPWGIVIAFVASTMVIAIISLTPAGLRARAVGRNEAAAARLGVAVPRIQALVFTAAGALSGLAGALVVLGLRYEISPGWAPLWGFGGILIAFITMRTPMLIPLWAVLFGMMESSGSTLKGAASVPDSVVVVMQTLPVVALFAIEWARRGIARPPRQARIVGPDSAKAATPSA